MSERKTIYHCLAHMSEEGYRKIRGRFFDPFLIKGLKNPVRNKSH